MNIWIEDVYSHIGYSGFPEDDFINVEIQECKGEYRGSCTVKHRGLIKGGLWQTKRNKKLNVITRIEEKLADRNEWGWWQDGKKLNYFIYVKKLNERNVYGSLKFEDLEMRLELYEFVHVFDFVKNPKERDGNRLERVL